MEKYITSIKDLVIESMKNDSQIQYQANNSKPRGCFKKGMINLLGINKPIDFKEATRYFSNQSLTDNQLANCLLGFIAECEGDFSSAFHYYAKPESNEKDSYLERVIKGRNSIKAFLKEYDLPITLNREISAILNDYSKGKASKIGAAIKIAAICNDEQSCLDAAKCFYDSNDYISAVQWLQKGNIGHDNPLYVAINKSFEKSRDTLLHSKNMQVIDLEGNSLLASEDLTPFLNKVKNTCEEASKKSAIVWKKENKKRIDTIIKKQKEKEYREMLEAEAEEKARKKRRNRIIKYCAIAASVLFFYFVSIDSCGNSDNNDSMNPNSEKQNYFSLHNFGNTSMISHCFIGNFTDSHGVFPVEIAFKSKGEEITDVVYKNVKIGGKIKMKCTNFEDNNMRFEGKDGKKDFILSLSWTDRNKLEGVANVGAKRLDVTLNADCTHDN